MSMTSMNESTMRRTHVRRPLSNLAAAAVLAASVVLGGCDGDNLFGGGGTIQRGEPVVTSVTAPAIASKGTSIDVRVRAVAPSGLELVTIRYSGVIDDEIERPFVSETDTVTINLSVAIPSQTADSLLVIEAFATDAGGRESPIVTDTVRIVDAGGPVVTASSTSTTASSGDSIMVTVSATDQDGLSSVGYAIVTEDGDTIDGGPLLQATTGTSRDTTFIVVLPNGLDATTLSIVGIAFNTSDVRGVSAPLVLQIVDAPPSVTILRPQDDNSHPLSDSLLVRVHVADSSGIASIRLYGEAVRRDSLQNTTIVQRFQLKEIPFPQPLAAMPLDTTVTRYLLPANVGESEEVNIIAVATDASGNVGADTVAIVDGPSIELLNPSNGLAVGLNSSVVVRLHAMDRVVGLDSVKVMISGVRQDSIVIRNLNARQDIDTTLVVTAGGSVGTLRLEPRVWNVRNVMGVGQAVTVNVETTTTSDTDRPNVRREVSTGDRVELDDTVRVTVTANDGSGTGITRVGVVAILTPDTDALTTRTRYMRSALVSPPANLLPNQVFEFTLGDLYSESEMEYPRRFSAQIHAFALDAAGNCGASLESDYMSAVCDTVLFAGDQYYTARGVTAASLQLTATDGQSISMPGGGTIADAVVDADRRRVYLSNITANRIDIFHLDADSFDITGSQPGACTGAGAGLASCRGVVGAGPWGMFINNGGDSLIVANSGGTNISFLPLDGPDYLREHVTRRLLTPNVVLWQLTGQISQGFLRLTKEYFDFSDRPQFVAQHVEGPLVYSTLPTAAAGFGTIRYTDTNPNAGATDDLPESYILYPGNALQEAEDSWALANIDSITVIRNTDDDDVVVLYDHEPGYYTQPGRPGVTIQSGALPILDAVADIRSQGSDAVVYAGAWNVDAVALSDTTFIAASTDRSRIAFGEGAASPTGRIIMCCDVQPGPPLSIGVSDAISINDLINNASERVFGLGLNSNGTLGVARGEQAAYYFTPDLRLQGEFRGGVAGGAGGAALHPDHAAPLESGDNALSFVATPDRTIKIIDTAHFYERGEIHIRDNIVGPLRAVMPAAAENSGLTPGDAEYIVVKLIGVTEGDNVVIVNVRRRHIL